MSAWWGAGGPSDSILGVPLQVTRIIPTESDI
jgi:hypothetical protein